MSNEAGGFRNELISAYASQSAGSASDSAPPVRVLLVEDDVAIRQMVANYLEGYNMRVASAARGEDVERHFAAAEPNLVILDLRLNDEDGLDLLRRIRARSDVPVIIVTGHRRDEIDRVVG